MDQAFLQGFFFGLSKEAFQQDTHQDCLANRLFREQAEKGELQDREMAGLTANLIGSGVENLE